MNYAIQSETCLFPYLEATSRKRATKHSLIHVDQGLVLVKLVLFFTFLVSFILVVLSFGLCM